MWTDLERVKRFLGIADTDTKDDDVIADAIAAAQQLAFDSRSRSGYTDNPGVSPNAGVTEGTTRWAALLYQSRGTGEGFAGFIDTGAVIGTPYYESRRTILLLLGVPRPTVDGPPTSPPAVAPPTFAPFYFDKAADVLNVPSLPTWTPVNMLEPVGMPAGVYLVGLSISYEYPTSSRSVYFRWRTGAAETWVEFVHEPGDSSDVVPLVYTFPREYDGVAFRFELEAAKETGGANADLDILYSDVWAQRVA